MKDYSQAAVERMMKIQEVILRAMAGKLLWFQAAEIIGVSPRQMQRMKKNYEELGYDGLYDRRLGKPSPRRVPMETAQEVLRLYQEVYQGFNVKHFHEKLTEKHGIQLSYTWVKMALQGAGLVKKERKRGKHRKRRPRRPLRGMMLHVDASKHQWFQDDRWYDFIVIMDDATSEVYYAQLVNEESTVTMMEALWEVVERKGVFCSLYSDRASHFFETAKAGDPVSRDRLTQIGRALKELGIEPIAAYSPQARGRSERGFRTWQGRLSNELRVGGISTVEAANRFLREKYIAEFNKGFQVESAEKGTAFVPCRRKDLELVFSLQHERVVGNDNTVRYANRILQIEKSKWRRTLAGCRVTVYEHLDGTLSVSYGPNIIGRYGADGQALERQAA